MKTPLFTGEQILSLIPQRPPMVMIDRFYGIENGVSRSGLQIRPDNLFCAGGHLQVSGIIEHMAQSAAARVGYLYTREGLPVPLGFIGSVEKLTVHSLPAVNTLITTDVTVVQEVFDITLITAAVRNEVNEIVAEGRMKIYLKK